MQWCLAIHILSIWPSNVQLHVVPSQSSACRWLDICLCNLLGVEKNHLQNERCQLQSWSMEKLVCLDLEIFAVVALHLDCKDFKHNWQFSTNFSNWSFRPGQYTVSLALSLHFVRPRWPSWMSFTISTCFALGTTILVSFNIRPSSMVSSSLNVQYGWFSLRSSLIVLGHPFWIVYLNIARVSSACGASHNCCKLSLLPLSWLVIW